MRRFFVTYKIDSENVSLTDLEQLHHLRDVLRLRAGDEVLVCDSSAGEYHCVIGEIKASEAVLRVKSRVEAPARQVRLTIACAIPRKTSMDDIVDGLTQLGADCIIPLETERVIVRLDEAGKKARLERWRRIARSAAQQSQRATIPQVKPVTVVGQVIADSEEFDLKLIPTLPGNRQSLREALNTAHARNILVLIGPEGDFTPEEVELARQAGFVPISLGQSVLRVATAAIAVASFIRLWLED